VRAHVSARTHLNVNSPVKEPIDGKPFLAQLRTHARACISDVSTHAKTHRSDDIVLYQHDQLDLRAGFGQALDVSESPTCKPGSSVTGKHGVSRAFVLIEKCPPASTSVRRSCERQTRVTFTHSSDLSARRRLLIR
jgi:hypothetical protein